MEDRDIVAKVREERLYAEGELPSWTTALIYALDANEHDDKSLAELERIVDRPKKEIKKYLRDPRILEKRAEWLAVSMEHAVEKAKSMIEPAMDNVGAVIKGEEKFSDKTEMSVVHLKGVGFYGTKIITEHKLQDASLYHRKIFEELNAKHNEGDWEELVKWYKEEENSKERNRC